MQVESTNRHRQPSRPGRRFGASAIGLAVPWAGGILSVVAACGGSAPAPVHREAPLPAAPPATRADAAATSSTTTTARAGPEVTDSPFRVALKLPREQRGWQAFVLDNAAIIVPELLDPEMPSSAFVVDPRGLHADEELLGGLPGGSVLRMRGTWPGALRVELNINPAGHGCLANFERRAGRWHEVKCSNPCCDSLAVSWWNPTQGTPAPLDVPWREGHRLYEKYDYEAETSIFVLDPKAVVRAHPQRARCKDRASTRLSGPFAGTVLSGERLVGAGPDCETEVISSETWARGARSSTVRPLPGSPKSSAPTFFTNVATFAPDGGGGVFLAFSTSSQDGYGQRPYVAHFDGTTWTDLACPATGGLYRFMALDDGALWLVAGDSGSKLWRSATNAQGDRQWIDETPAELPAGADFGHSQGLQRSPDGHIWLLTRQAVVERSGNGWRVHQAPRLDPSDPKSERYAPRAVLWTSWGETMVAAQAAGQFALLRWPQPAAG